MSDKDYKGAKGADGDDYKPLGFYKDRVSGVENGFASFSEGDEHYFAYLIDGEIVLISEDYTSTKGRDNGIASVEKNRFIDQRYKREVYQSDKYFFNLMAGNHQEIGTSAWFTSEAAMEIAIGRLMGKSDAPLTAAAIVGGVVATAPLAAMANDVSAVPLAAESSPVPPVQPSASSEEVEDEGKGVNWLWWLLPILLFLLAWYIFSQCCSKPIEEYTPASAVAPVVDELKVDEPKVEEPKVEEPKVEEPKVEAPAVVETIVSQAETAVGAVSDSASKLGEFLKDSLPGGIELNIPEFGTENNLLQFIRDDSKPIDKDTWFEFDRINFNTGKADLTLDSREQIANIAEILRAYPEVELKIGGYTDSTGSAAFNQSLSEDRAESVKNSLITQGVDQRRLTSEGYGSQFPVASNDTPEGRAKNRRIALRVTAK